MNENVLTPKTLVPIGILTTVIPIVFWIAGLSNKVENQAQGAIEIKKSISDIMVSRSSIEIEIMQEVKSLNIANSDIERKIAVLDTKLSMLIDMVKKGQQ